MVEVGQGVAAKDVHINLTRGTSHGVTIQVHRVPDPGDLDESQYC